MTAGPCCPGRRTMLKAAGAAAVTVPLLSACGSGDRPAGVSTTADDGSVRLDVADLGVGQSRHYSDARVVVSRPAEDSYVVFDQACPHQGCAVSGEEDGKLVCPCHSSYFDATTGDVLSGPSATGLVVVPSTLEGTEIVLRG